MYVLSINTMKSNYQIAQFKGNANIKAVLAKKNEVIKELNINTGTSYVANLLRMPHNADKVDFWNDLWGILKKNIPSADSVEKLELLKTYGISLLNYTEQEISQFLKFLKSKPSDKNVYFLQTAMNVARKGEIEYQENGTLHSVFEDFEPVLDYVLSDKEHKLDFAYSNKSHIEEHIDLIKRFHYDHEKITEKSANSIIATIHELLSNEFEQYAHYGHSRYGTKAIKTESDKYKWIYYINVGALDVDGCTEITIGLDNIPRRFYDAYDSVSPVKRQLFILLDKNKKLSKLKLFSYDELKELPKYLKNYPEYKNFTTDDEYYKTQIKKTKYQHINLEHCTSPFGDKLPDWVSLGYLSGKYHLRTIEFDADTKTAELKHYDGITGTHWPEKFKLVVSATDDLGIMTDKEHPISFIPTEPTAYDLQQMINNDKTNNLMKILNFSGWKDVFFKIIKEFEN